MTTTANTVSDDTGFLEAILNLAAAEAAVADGRPLDWVALHHGASATMAAASQRDTAGRHGGQGPANKWTNEELAFLKENAGVIADPEIAHALGRSLNAVDVKRGRLGLPTPLRHGEYLTATQAAICLGVDAKFIIRLIQEGRMPGSEIKVSKSLFYRTKRSDFYRWCVNPENWPYFWRVIRDTSRIEDDHLRRLVELRKARWGDEWWTPSQVGDYHGVSHTRVNDYIHQGKLKGFRWDVWLIKRSEATRPDIRFFHGRGGGHMAMFGTPEGDAFLLLALAVGHSYTVVERMMKRGNAASRLWTVVRKGHVPNLNRAFGMDVSFKLGTPAGRYKLRGAAVYADWQPYAHRFPRLAAACRKFADAVGSNALKLETLTLNEWNLVCGALFVAARWRWGSDDPLVKRLACRPLSSRSGPAIVRVARVAWERLGGSWDAAARPNEGGAG